MERRDIESRIGRATMCVLWALVAPLVSAADPLVGATVTGSAGKTSVICTTCPVDSVSFPTVKDGGAGHDSAALDVVDPGYTIAGRAALGGALELPDLGALASVHVLVDPSIPKTSFYRAGVTAEGLQKYVYGGTTSQTYRIDFTVVGSFFLTASDPSSLMDVVGGMTIFKDGYTPGAEFNPSYGFDFQQAHVTVAGAAPFTLTGSVSFTLDPGAAFYVKALLDVTATTNVAHQVEGTIDVLHTMSLSFSQGDTSQLSIVSAVPLPAASWLGASGVLALGAVARPRRSACRAAAVRGRQARARGTRNPKHVWMRSMP